MGFNSAFKGLSSRLFGMIDKLMPNDELDGACEEAMWRGLRW